MSVCVSGCFWGVVCLCPLCVCLTVCCVCMPGDGYGKRKHTNFPFLREPKNSRGAASSARRRTRSRRRCRRCWCWPLGAKGWFVVASSLAWRAEKNPWSVRPIGVLLQCTMAPRPFVVCRCGVGAICLGCGGGDVRGRRVFVYEHVSRASMCVRLSVLRCALSVWVANVTPLNGKCAEYGDDLGWWLTGVLFMCKCEICVLCVVDIYCIRTGKKRRVFCVFVAARASLVLCINIIVNESPSLHSSSATSRIDSVPYHSRVASVVVLEFYYTAIYVYKYLFVVCVMLMASGVWMLVWDWMPIFVEDEGLGCHVWYVVRLLCATGCVAELY